MRRDTQATRGRAHRGRSTKDQRRALGPETDLAVWTTGLGDLMGRLECRLIFTYPRRGLVVLPEGGGKVRDRRPGSGVRRRRRRRERLCAGRGGGDGGFPSEPPPPVRIPVTIAATTTPGHTPWGGCSGTEGNPSIPHDSVRVNAQPGRQSADRPTTAPRYAYPGHGYSPVLLTRIRGTRTTTSARGGQELHKAGNHRQPMPAQTQQAKLDQTQRHRSS
jgi:hypothetical protein